MPIVDDAHDAFGRALVDHLEDRDGPELVLECDDGSSWTADMQPRDFFAPPEVWPSWERDALAHAAGSVLDLGAGGGGTLSTSRLAGMSLPRSMHLPERRPS